MADSGWSVDCSFPVKFVLQLNCNSVGCGNKVASRNSNFMEDFTMLPREDVFVLNSTPFWRFPVSYLQFIIGGQSPQYRTSQVTIRTSRSLNSMESLDIWSSLMRKEQIGSDAAIWNCKSFSPWSRGNKAGFEQKKHHRTELGPLFYETRSWHWAFPSLHSSGVVHRYQSG